MIVPVIRLLALLQVYYTATTAFSLAGKTTTTRSISFVLLHQQHYRSSSKEQQEGAARRSSHQQQGRRVNRSSSDSRSRNFPSCYTRLQAAASAANGDDHSHDAATTPTLKRVSPDLEGLPVPFVDVTGKAFIECYADTVAQVDGVEYTIGVPCDYAVALCYFNDGDSSEEEQLVPIELDDELMDDVFPVAEGIVAEGKRVR